MGKTQWMEARAWFPDDPDDLKKALYGGLHPPSQRSAPANVSAPSPLGGEAGAGRERERERESKGGRGDRGRERGVEGRERAREGAGTGQKSKVFGNLGQSESKGMLKHWLSNTL